MSRPVTDKNYLFIGGPMDQERMKTGGRKTFRMMVPADLTHMLASSLEALTGPTAAPSVRIARYVLEDRALLRGFPNMTLFDQQAYRFDGWES